MLVLAVACDGNGGADPSPPATTGAPPELTPASATTAVDALCRMATLEDATEAKARFYDDAHVTLHAIAAEASENDVGSDTDLLVAMQRVEAELERASLPPGYGEDIRALRMVTTETLGSIGLVGIGC